MWYGGNLYIGIDWSNDGRIPEIIVGVLSHHKEDILKGNFQKMRGRHSRLLEYLGDREFLYCSADSMRYIKSGRRGALIALVIKQLYDRSESTKSLGKIIIDGHLTLEELDLMDCSLSGAFGSGSKDLPLVVTPCADTSYPLVNMADALANMLYRYHNSQKGAVLEKYSDNRIIIPTSLLPQTF